MVDENKVEDPQKLEERLEDLRVRWEAISALPRLGSYQDPT